MLIHQVTLHNIRSYEDATMGFEEGITLLSGDIGAGKSSLLQAIEFGLFGIQRGGLEGDGLLRHGTESGSVDLTFSIDGVEHTVSRTLKRTGQGVRQTEGSLVTEGVETELSAQELKAQVLHLLGYPEQLLTKSKGLIFRHTVYTPQEEMKQILFMPPEDRLNTLRVLFGIERYRLIKENCQLLLKDLRAEERALLAQASFASQLQRDVDDATIRASTTQGAVDLAQEKAKHASATTHKARQELDAARRAWDYNMGLEHQRSGLQQRIKEIDRSLANAQEDIARIDAYLEVAVETAVDNTAAIDALRTRQIELDETLIQTTSELASIRGERSLHLSQEKTITTMDNCPVCKQHVTTDHKDHIHAATEKTLAQLDSRTAGLTVREQMLRAERTTLATKLQQLNDLQKRFAAYQKELLQRRDQERQKHLLESRRMTLSEDRGRSAETLATLAEPDVTVKELYLAAQQRVTADEAAMQEALAMLSLAREQHSATATQLAIATERLGQALVSQDRAARIQQRRAWLEEQFLELVTVIERHVLASIHAEFRDLFSQWFGKLVEDDTMTVSLGEQFEPLITQNGYDAGLDQLSGGEKTAVALSYRLSLYKVVSDFISSIRTKDLLILDEPTDGFSSEQLDRVRDVLRELGCRQVILVSHENQMEASCDHVVRIRKQLHRSTF